MSNQQIGVMLNRDIQLAYRDFAMGLLDQCGNNPKLGDVPIQFKEPIYGTMNPSFTDFVAPGVILTWVFSYSNIFFYCVIYIYIFIFLLFSLVFG